MRRDGGIRERRAWVRMLPEGGGDRRKRSWEVRAQLKVDWVRATAKAAEGRSDKRWDEARQEVDHHLKLAEWYLDKRALPDTWLRGTRVQGAWGHINAATVRLVDVVDDDQLVGLIPQIIALVGRYLEPSEPERAAMRRWFDLFMPDGRDVRDHALPVESQVITSGDRAVLSAGLRAANERSASEYHRLHRFQGPLVGAALALLFLVYMVTVLGWQKPSLIPICFPASAAATEVAGSSEEAVPQICPSGGGAPSSGDIGTVVLLGLVGASLTSVPFVVRRAPPVDLPILTLRVFQALLKVATGMLTAVVGILFMSAGAAPGFSNIDNRAQILIYALVFGAAQQLVTRLIDARSNEALSIVTPTEPRGSDTAVGSGTGTNIERD